MKANRKASECERQSQSSQGWGEGRSRVHLQELAQQAKGDGSRSAAHLQNEGAALGSHCTRPLGHLLQHPLNQFLQDRGVWITVSSRVAVIESKRPKSGCPACQLGPWAGPLAAPCLSFPICKTEHS